ncbi:MAG: SsrA-binding protein SmpB [Clostridia bacterium]|nr:SsrA-binding protein SmpB [Clostridia bacterium]
MEGIKIVATNKKAYHEYFIDETYEAGVVLVGSEVKSVRGGKVSFADSFVSIKDGQAILENFHITPYEKGSAFNPEARRDRVLLLSRREIDHLRAAVERKGYTIVATKIYLKHSLVKFEIGLARGKHSYDKRQSLKEKQLDRDARRAIQGE